MQDLLQEIPKKHLTLKASIQTDISKVLRPQSKLHILFSLKNIKLTVTYLSCIFFLKDSVLIRPCDPVWPFSYPSVTLRWPLLWWLSRVKRRPDRSRGIWGERGSWRSSGAKLRSRCRRDFAHVTRPLGEGTGPSGRSSCWGEGGRSWGGEVGTSPLPCSASWTGRRTWRLHSAVKWSQWDRASERIMSLWVLPCKRNCAIYDMHSNVIITLQPNSLSA